MPDELSPRRLRHRLVQLAVVAAVIAAAVAISPGLGTLRTRLTHASAGWLIVGVASEFLSAVCYVVIFRAVFCARMSWRLAYQIGLAEQAANSVFSASGAGGLALGAWALHRGGMSTEYIGRRTVAFFFLTSMANIGGVILFAVLYATGLLGHDPDRALTYGFGGAATVATLIVLALPALLRERVSESSVEKRSTRVAAAVRFIRHSVGQGVRDGLLLLRHRSPGVLIGSIGTMAFDLAVLGVSFRAFGYSPPLGVLVLGYLIGQLGGNLPIPGGIGGLDGGLIGAFALYHAPLATTTAAVLAYHAISLWLPTILGSVAFVQLRNTLQRQAEPAVICMPLADPIEAERPSTTAR